MYFTGWLRVFLRRPPLAASVSAVPPFVPPSAVAWGGFGVLGRCAFLSGSAAPPLARPLLRWCLCFLRGLCWRSLRVRSVLFSGAPYRSLFVPLRSVGALPHRRRSRLAGVPSRLPYPAPLAVFPRGSSRGARQPPLSKTGVEITPVTTAPPQIASAWGSLCRLPAPLRGHLVARGLAPAAGIARMAQRVSVLFPLRVPFRSLSPCIFPPRTPYFFRWDITHY